MTELVKFIESCAELGVSHVIIPEPTSKFKELFESELDSTVYTSVKSPSELDGLKYRSYMLGPVTIHFK